MLRENLKGNWKKAHKLAEEFMVRAKVQAELEQQRVENLKKLHELALDLYNNIPVFDALYYDSPLAPLKIRYHLQAYSKKLGMPGIKGILTPAIEIPELTKALEDAVSWAFKFEKRDEKVS